MVNGTDAVGIGINPFCAIKDDRVVSPGGLEQLIHDGNIFLRELITVIMLHEIISHGNSKSTRLEK